MINIFRKKYEFPDAVDNVLKAVLRNSNNPNQALSIISCVFCIAIARFAKPNQEKLFFEKFMDDTRLKFDEIIEQTEIKMKRGERP